MLQSSAGTVPVRKFEWKLLRSPPPTRDCITGMQCGASTKQHTRTRARTHARPTYAHTCTDTHVHRHAHAHTAAHSSALRMRMVLRRGRRPRLLRR